MTIEYRQTRDFTEEDLRRLFLSVGWELGRYPKRLVTAMRNSTHVISAWDGVIGLVRALDDGATIAFLHYVLVDPKYQGRHIGDELMKRIMKNFTDLLHVKVIPVRSEDHHVLRALRIPPVRQLLGNGEEEHAE
ncbi:GNAT family N-acetyltransferase [Ligilactobacillus ruminis]|uniref:GNAT family N-acetyltransferase n=1 Tax=Ligilactobacillus ruminis TaxID=1623 RepID=UPI001F27E5AA|nr:GNAT family N-acetyltransferase [Ligilactobacillus ruminis]